jgi:DNA-binding NarL/FixJ family response regulator
MKVLIVDDSKIVCNGLQQMLINIADIEIVGQPIHLGSKARCGDPGHTHAR